MLARFTTGLLECLFISAVMLVIGCIVVPLSAVMSLYWGWAFSLLWSWFVVPVFHLPSLSPLQSAGLLLPVAMTNAALLNEMLKKPDKEDAWKASFAGGLVGPLMILLVGSVLRHFM